MVKFRALYSLFSRIVEILEITRQRLRLLDERYAAKMEN